MRFHVEFTDIIDNVYDEDEAHLFLLTYLEQCVRDKDVSAFEFTAKEYHEL